MILEYIMIGLLAVVILLLIVLLLKNPERNIDQLVAGRVSDELDQATEDIVRSVKHMGDGNITAINAISNSLGMNQQIASEAQKTQLDLIQTSINDQLGRMGNQIRGLSQANEQRLEAMRTALDTNMQQLRSDNEKKLEEIRGTVDEKLQTTLEKRISESFKTVSDQLEQVYKGLGEMQTIASDVGSLKRVLTTVKSRGIMGEIALGAIIEDILAPEQYETNFATIPGSSERVEFAIKLPAEDGIIYLPIDSKFPGDTYAKLLDAQESGDKEAVAAAYKNLENTIRQEAKDIRKKYVSVPYTTNFGILFLPYEGLYAEAVSHGLIERLQKDHQINIAGPSTMAALLNSLQMGFKTLAIQKRSGEVWEILSAVKTEFDNFEDVMKKMQSHLNATSNDLEKLMGVRTRKIQKKLQNVQKLDDVTADTILRIEDLDYLDEE